MAEAAREAKTRNSGKLQVALDLILMIILPEGFNFWGVHLENEVNSWPARFARGKEVISYFTTIYSAVVALAAVSGVIGLTGLISSLAKIETTPENVSLLKHYLYVSSAASLIFFIASIYLILSTARLRRLLRIYLEVWPPFLQMARQNAQCDKALFLSLFIELKASIAKERKLNNLLKQFITSNVSKAEGQCRDNIDFIVNQAAAVFDASTGVKCAVALKAASKDGVIKTLRRDTLSAMLRQENEDKEFKIADNTAYVATLEKRERFYVCDDLLKAARAKDYKNSRDKWWKDYNATLVYRISSEEEPEFNWLFCVDNFKGGFNRPEVIRSAAEICERLGVMIHRLLSLERIRVAEQEETQELEQERLRPRT